MPSRKLTEMVPRHEFTQACWIALAEERRAMIKSLLSRFTLERLGAVSCLRKGRYGTGTLKDDSPIVEPGSLASGLNTEGIWSKSFPSRMPGSSWNGLWGLGRSGSWILVKLDIKHDGGDERARRVDVREVEITELVSDLGVYPYNLWNRLAGQVNEWEVEHEKRYGSLKHLAETFRDDYALVRLLSR